MLRLILGKAGTGKTAAVIEEIARAVRRGQGGRIFLVPEQYSHEAERELCAACGDSLSLYAEVLSFTGLARRVRQRLGGGAVPTLDQGGRLLCMAQALGGVGHRLKLYGAARRRAELQVSLLSALDELKAACVTPEKLEEAAQAAGGALGDKLRDLSLVAAAYDAAVANGHADPADRLDVLARQLGQGGLAPGAVVYVDGFVDFTLQEHRVLSALLSAGAELTVCMTVDRMEGADEIYELSRRSCRRLIREAEELGTETRVEILEEDSAGDQLRYFAGNMFSFSPEPFQGETGRISLYSAGSIAAECELAAARALELVREEGCRWRDIAVAVRGFEDYRRTLESVFRLYGVPLFVAGKSALLSKPLPALIAAAYEIVEGGWDVDDVTDYIRTGLTGLSPREGDELAGYIYKWQLRASAWEREGDWRQHPEGYGAAYDEAAERRLEEINALRRRLAGPLLAFRQRGREARTAQGQAAALARLLEELELAGRLEVRAGELEDRGMEELGQELRQLWELTVSALEQCAAVLGDTELGMADFGRLFIRMLSMYDVGTIPVSLDRVSAGDFDRMRRRRIRHLIVLGCGDDRLPQAGTEGGVFSPEERERLLELDISLAGGESELWREFSLIYNCLSLPSGTLTMSYPLMGTGGEALRPASVFSRAAALFSLPVQPADMDAVRLSAPGPALALAAQAEKGGGPAAQAAAAFFRQTEPERLERLHAAARLSRGHLSREAVDALYGQRLRLSASRVDKLASCQYAYFCQYGLKAKPYEPAGFTPPEVGVFMHYVLEHTAREAGDFKSLPDARLRALVGKYVRQYIHEELNDFNEKSARFVYLFRRLEGDVQQVAADMAAELRRSDFTPLDFELNFARAKELGPLELEGDREGVTLTGVADRVDGWLHKGKLYLRVVDYKTGRKSFSLTDVYYGMGMQMLLYLFALQAGGEKRYGHEIVPAGVMYVPARNDMTAADYELDDAEAELQRKKTVRRSGFVLDDPAVLEAWEKGPEKAYIPVKFNRGRPDRETLATAEQIGALSRRVRATLGDMAKELRSGSIAADPYYKNQQANACRNCEFFDACHFDHGSRGESFRFLPDREPEEVWGPEKGEHTDE